MTAERNLSAAKPQTGKGSGRGGPRAGAGRKPYPPELKKITLTIRVRPTDIERVKAFVHSLDAANKKLKFFKKSVDNSKKF